MTQSAKPYAAISTFVTPPPVALGPSQQVPAVASTKTPATALPDESALARVARRTADITIASLALIVLLPLMLFIAIGIRLTSEGPALFKQQRVGRDRSPFTCYKFRTMRQDCDDAVLRDLVARQLRGEDTSTKGHWKVTDDDRITRLGAVLRQTSLDELPQLFNVLLGSMSLVGPRPVLDWQADSFPPEFDLRYAVRPGLTGLWQVSGRSNVSIVEMLRLDALYVKRRTLGLDFILLFKTVPVVLRRDGAR